MLLLEFGKIEVNISAMSSGEKKGGKGKAPSRPRQSKAPLNDHRFRGEGVKFKCKIVGSVDVTSAKGDSVCTEAIKKLKMQALKLNKESGEHKQKVLMYVNLKGIRIVDEKTQKVQHEHPINKISFITHDPDDKRTFGYVCSQPCTTGHKLYAIKSEKPAAAVTGTLYELFQIVFKMRKEAGLTKKVPNSSQVQKSPQVSNGPNVNSLQNSDGIYEVPYKDGNNKEVQPSGHSDNVYTEPLPPSEKNEPHYKVPNSDNPPLYAVPSSKRLNNGGDEEKINDTFKSSPLLSRLQSFDKEPDQVSQTSVPGSPFPTHDNSSDKAFFSPSVFEAVPSESGIGDTVSIASSADISVLRSDSVSSGSSGTRSQNSRSNSFIHQTAEGIQPGNASTFNDAGKIGTTAAGSDHDQPADNQSQENFSVGFPSLGHMEETWQEANAEDSKVQVVDTSTSNTELFTRTSDPFASTNNDEETLTVSGEGFFTESFAKFDSAFGDSTGGSQVKDDFSSSDPFAPSGEGDIKNAETSFKAAFSLEKFAPSQLNTDTTLDDSPREMGEGEVEQVAIHVENSFGSVSWDNNSFTEKENEPWPSSAEKSDEDKGLSNETCSEGLAIGTTESESQPIETQVTATSKIQQFSWAESFTSDDTAVTAKADPNKSALFSWDDAFGTVHEESKSSSGQPFNAFSWDDAFGEKNSDASGSPFDSSAFGDAFESSGKVESSNDKNVTSISDAQFPVADSDLMTPLPSQAAGSSANDEEAEKELTSASIDPFDEFDISPVTPEANPKIVTPEETSGTYKSDIINAFGEVPTLKENLSFEQNPKDNADVKETEESTEEITEESNEESTKDAEEEELKEGQPPGLQIKESGLSLSERPISPTAPPPLPPRPVVSAPPLPMRPSGSSSTGSPVKTPISSQLSVESPPSNSSQQGKKGSAKKAPPPPPPRVDLNEKSAVVYSNQKENFPDPFSSDFFENNVLGNNNGEANSEWTTSWPNLPEVPLKKKSYDQPDPFSDSFFTNFDFNQKSAGSNELKDNSDPFTTSNSSSEPFPAVFGGDDLFAAFTPAKVDVPFGEGGPFQNDLSDSFSAFPSGDPFGDISDPFADKGPFSDDPFGDSPTKPGNGVSLTLNESLSASDEADSFA